MLQVYSYKEQMEEIALRKELEEKRKKEGKFKAPELSPKQKEAMKAQLEKEAVVRENVKNLVAGCRSALLLLEATLEGEPEVLATEFSSLLPLFYK